MLHAQVARQVLALLGAWACVTVADASGADLDKRAGPAPAVVTTVDDIFPRSDIVLQEGDIILAGSLTLMAMVISRCAIPVGVYCHTALYFRTDTGEGRILAMGNEGLEVLPPGEFYSRYDRLALVRPVGPAAARARLGAAARDFWADSRTHPVRFDSACRKAGPADRTFFCNELVSYVYLAAGRPDPFVLDAGVKPSRWTEWVARHTGIDLFQAVSPDAVLTASGFATLCEVRRSEATRRPETIGATIIDRGRYYIEVEQRDLRPPRLGSRLLLALGSLWPAKHETIYQFPKSVRWATGLAVKDYFITCAQRTLKTIAAAADEPWPDDKVRQLTEQVCDAYRDRYFTPPATAGQTPGRRATALGTGGAGVAGVEQLQGWANVR